MQKSESSLSAILWMLATFAASILVVAISFWTYPRAALLATAVCIGVLLLEVRFGKSTLPRGRLRNLDSTL